MDTSHIAKAFLFTLVAVIFISLHVPGLADDLDCTDGRHNAIDSELTLQLVAYANGVDLTDTEFQTSGSSPLLSLQSQTDALNTINSAEDDKNGSCIKCHSNAGYLIKHVKPAEAPPEDGCATAPGRPPFLNSFVKADFTDSIHGQIGCIGCHGGDAESSDTETAHIGVSSGARTCAGCHQDISERHASSLHKTLNGMRHALELRTGVDNFHRVETAWQADCASCHAECSDCHVSQPAAIGGGLLKGHEFLERPPMQETCAVCHGSRAGGEYLGHFEGIEADVHYKAGMHCLDCHTNDLHGDGQEYQTRWQVKDSPSCTDCHEAIPNQSVAAHDSRHENLSCQVCHSQPYQNCFSCHATIEEGQYYRSVDHKDLDFKIGKNTVTRSNRSCSNCHGNDEIFLKESDLDPDGSAANRNSLLLKLP